MKLSNIRELKKYKRDCYLPNDVIHYYYIAIYSLINLENGKRYIGRSTNPRSRIQSHLTALKNKRHSNELMMQDADCEFGFEILADNYRDSIEAGEAERHYMIKYKTYLDEYGYNGNDPAMVAYKKSLQEKTYENKITYVYKQE